MLLALCLTFFLAAAESRPQRQTTRQRRDDALDYCLVDHEPTYITVTVPAASAITIVQTETLIQFVNVPTYIPGNTPSGAGITGEASKPGPYGGFGSSSGVSPWSHAGDGDVNPYPAPDNTIPGPRSHPEQSNTQSSPLPWSFPARNQPSSFPSTDASSSTPSNRPSSFSSTWKLGSSSSSNTYLATTSSSSSGTSSTPNPTPTPDDWPDHTVTAYFGAGNTDIFPAENIPWQYLTHLCFAFASTGGADVDFAIKFNETLLQYLSEQATTYGVKLILSVGGYGKGGQYFSDIVQTNETIDAFVRSVQDAVSDFNLAGVDLDWEFVGSLAEGNNRPATDAAGYLSMLKALRTAMPLAELSAAVPMFQFLEAKTANSSSLSYVDMHPYVEYFDRVYLMAYDLWNGPDTAGSNGALDPDEGINPDNINQDQQFGSQGVQAWNEAGFPLSKLVYGVPFYGYGWNIVTDSDPAKTGLYTRSSGKSSGDSNEDPTGNSGFWKWRNLKSQNVVQQQSDGSYAAGPGWIYGFDHSTQTPYVFNGENSTKPQLISYDDPYSLQLKRSYAKSLGMNGMMFWAMYGDTDDGELTQILNEN
ncbi:hypothetical protein LTR72_000872 [Exophiala xenobiotica]|nr:hypothetical protein LTR72_000872 [Exophiala xenobiotica]KAK5288306.1 hypothetical protein LTR14_008164 [Exophiala xenobiotica]KAK5314174.1 hypothetical protein LTR93_010453 [Exophiala xenobiotica]KAK5476582.1 hypothetical protein LTR55_008635 [Exophiala xenobiotica]